MSDLISREKLLNEINLLKKSPWYNKDFAAVKLVRKDAVAVVEKCVEEAPGVTEWISVKDRLPDTDYLYIVCRTFAGHQIVFAALWENKKFISVVKHNPLEYITHWTYLPEPPKENDAE